MAEKSKTDAGSISVELAASGLPPEVVSKLSRALQQTLLSQLADLNPSTIARIDLGSPAKSKIQVPRVRTDGIVAQFEFPE